MQRARTRTSVNHQQPSLFDKQASDETLAAVSDLGTVSFGSKTSIHIERIIVHGLNNRLPEPELCELSVTQDQQIEQFFEKHISEAVRRAQWDARFVDSGGDIPTLCHQLLGDETNFVEASRNLARNLHAHMRARPATITPGNFAVVVYSDNTALSKHIALFKLDPDRSRLKLDFDTSSGHRRAILAEAQNVLPDTKQVHKCALLAEASSVGGFDVRLLDTQARSTSSEVAEYFYEKFLTTRLSPSPRRFTRRFLQVTERWLVEKARDMRPKELLEFYDARRAALGGTVLVLADFVGAALPSHPELGQDLLRCLSHELSEGEAGYEVHQFRIDQRFAESMINYVTMGLEGGATLKVPVDRFRELVTLEPDRTSEGKFRLVIMSGTLNEVV